MLIYHSSEKTGNRCRCQSKCLEALSHPISEIRHSALHPDSHGAVHLLRLWSVREPTERKWNMADIYLHMSQGSPQSLRGKFS